MARQSSGHAEAATPSARHGRLGHTHPLLSLLKFGGIVVAVIAVSATSVVGIAAWQLTAVIGKNTVHLAGQPDNAPPALGPTEGEVNLLLTGTDTRTGQDGFQSKDELAGSSGAGSNDVNLLVHISKDHRSVTVVSFPRDLEIPIPACPKASGGTVPPTSQAMLNTTLARGDLSCVALTINSMTGVKIPYAAEIKFKGVIAMSNAVGGVTVCLATPLKDDYTLPPLDLAAGQQTLVGPQALSFLRSRHGVGDGGDLGRISNQQVFMSALARQVVSGGVLGDPTKLYPLADAAVKNTTLSDTLANPLTLVSIALALKNVGLENMLFVQYPTFADPRDKNRVIPDPAAAAVLNAALVDDSRMIFTGKPGGAAQLAPSTPPPPATTATPSSPSADPSTPSAPSVSLPSSITGQTADQQTCTKKDTR